MNAGLPGIGISGVFYIVSALLMPFTEAVRALRGKSRRRPWRAVFTHWVIAASMVAAMYGTGRILTLVLRATGHRVAASDLWSSVIVALMPFVIVLGAVQLVTVLRGRRSSPISS